MQIVRQGLLIVLLGLVFIGNSFSQAPRRWNSADIYEGIRKLQFLGSALYIAAHPDDENTRLIAYLANEVKAETAYLSITRGDGGQNLIGPEISELLGLIRTQELLAARRIDGGRQFFTRANDFGYSKHPDETFAIWNHDEVLSDMVWVIRQFQPDVIINRFDHRTPGRTHGHHTGSAMLSVEAFEKAADPQAFAEQLKYINTWQPRRLFFNTSWWFYGSQEAFAKADKSNLVTVETGQYLPLLGESIAEMAARSRSQHSSQGFGSLGSRGTADEYLELLKGDMPPGQDQIFAGINTSWSRVKGGEAVGEALQRIQKDFDFTRPERSVPALLAVKAKIEKLPDGHWTRTKLAELREIIAAAMGLYLEAVAADPTAAPGRPVELNLEAINRSDAQVRLQRLALAPGDQDTTLNAMLEPNQGVSWEQTLRLPTNTDYTSAYWLRETPKLGMYNVKDQLLRGQPETPPVAQVTFDIEVYDPSAEQWSSLQLTRPVVYKYEDPARGEVYRPFEITPPVAVNLDQGVMVFADDQPKTVQVKVTAGRDDLRGKLELRRGQGWRTEPASYELTMAKKGEEQTFRFEVFPPKQQMESVITPVAVIEGQAYDDALTVIDYAHIPLQTVYLDAATKVVRVDLQRAGRNVGYLSGAGDDIPAALEQIGYDVTLLGDRDMTPARLDQFDAVILGVRTYNTIDRIGVYQPLLLDYAKRGGTLIVQYNTGHDLKLPADAISPYLLKISRERVTDETAEVRLLAPDHPVLNHPNKITKKDFEGWVQERGLYFPNEWGSEFTPILASNDPGEPSREGGLLVAKYGDGYFVYTGYSWFRELPAGVPGAYRLFANLISLGN